MGYSFQPISVPSSNPSLDFGTLPKFELGDIKSLTSFMDRQRKLEEDDSKKVSELSKLLFDSLKDTEHLDWAIGDDPKGRQYFNDVINYYRTRIQSLSENAGKPGVIRELSKIETELRNDIYSPTGRLSPYVNAAKEKKRYEERKKSPDYEKSLSVDPFYDLNNRRAFENWKGALRWDDEGKPYYASLRLQETAPAINIQKIIEDTKKAVEESDLIPALAYTENGMLVEQEASRGRNRAHIINVLRMNPQFQELRDRAIKSLGDNPSKEDLEKLDKDLERTFVDPIIGFKQGKVSRKDDPNSLNYEEQLNENRLLRQEEFKRQQEALNNYYKSLSLQQKERHHLENKELQKQKLASQQEKMNGGIGAIDFVLRKTSVMGDIYNKYKGEDYISPAKFIAELKNHPNIYNRILNTKEYKDWENFKLKAINPINSNSLRTSDPVKYDRLLKETEILKKGSNLYKAEKFLKEKFSGSDGEPLKQYLNSSGLINVIKTNGNVAFIPLNKQIHKPEANRYLLGFKNSIASKYILPKGYSWKSNKVKKEGEEEKYTPYVTDIGYTQGSKHPTVRMSNGKIFELEPKDNTTNMDVKESIEKYLILLKSAAVDEQGSLKKLSIEQTLLNKKYSLIFQNQGTDGALRMSRFLDTNGANVNEHEQTFDFGPHLGSITVRKDNDKYIANLINYKGFSNEEWSYIKENNIDLVNFVVNSPNDLAEILLGNN